MKTARPAAQLHPVQQRGQRVHLEPIPTNERLQFAQVLPALLLMAGFLLIEPNLLASQLKHVGVSLVAAAAVLAVLNDRGVIKWAQGSGIVLAFTFATTLWVTAVDSTSGRDPVFSLTDGLILFICVISSGLVLSKPARVKFFIRAFVFLVAAISVSYIVTTCLWLVSSIGDAVVAKIPVGTWTATVYFPFTSTTGTQTFFGVTLPRLAGFGREPGWMSMYAGVAFFLAPLVINSRRKLFWARIGCLTAVLAPISTGGFAVFIIAAAYDLFLTRREGASLSETFFRRAFGILVSAGALWLVFTAPVLGLNAKESMNSVSLSERSLVTDKGLSALAEISLGGPVDYPNSSVNLIASVAPNGWPFLLLVLASLLAPRFHHPFPGKTTAAIGVITLTLLFSQPTAASSAVFILVVAIYAGTHERLSPKISENAASGSETRMS